VVDIAREGARMQERASIHEEEEEWNDDISDSDESMDLHIEEKLEEESV
jgi:hypothetical protein